MCATSGASEHIPRDKNGDLLLDGEIADANGLRLPALVELLHARPRLIEKRGVVAHQITVLVNHVLTLRYQQISAAAAPED